MRLSRIYGVYHKKHKTLPNNPPINIYINRINSRLVFKIKDGYKLELQIPETMKCFVRTKKLIDKTKSGYTEPILEVVEAVLFQCDLVENQYQPKSYIINTFTSNKSYACLLNVETINLVFLKT